MNCVKAYLKRDEGAALVTVLLIITVMSAGIVLALETVNYAVKRSVAVQLYTQTRFYAQGGEQMARVAAEKLYDTDQALKAVLGHGDEAEVSFPLDRGGFIRGHLKDASNCFNLNSLVQSQEQDTYFANETNIEQYQRLLVTLGMSESQSLSLAATLVDWLDSDSRPIRGGAEDYEYSALEIPYRTANSLLVDITELRLVKGYTTKVINLIQPFVCILPQTEGIPVNVNSLTPEQAPLLMSLVGSKLSLSNTARLISERPARGYSDIAAFWNQKAFEGITLSQELRAKAGIRPRLFRANITVKYLEADVKLMSLIQMNNDGSSVLVSRRYGAMF